MPIITISVSISITTIVSRGPPYVPDIALNILQVGFDSILLIKGYSQPALAFVNENTAVAFYLQIVYDGLSHFIRI